MESNNEVNLDTEFSEILTTLMMQAQEVGILIELADEKLKALRENDTNKLLLIVNEEERLSQSIIKLEKQRHFCVKDVEEKVGYKIANISSLMGSFSGEDKVAIEEVAKELKDKMKTLKSKNDINVTLLEVFLDQAEVINNLITGEKAPTIYADVKKNKNKKGYGMDVAAEDSYFDSKY